MKKSLCLFMALMVIMAASCTKQNQDPIADAGSDAAITDGSAESATDIAEEISIFDILPQNDFNGDTFTAYIPRNPDSPVDKGTFVEEEIGEKFNDAVYNRNRKIEDIYNVKINPVYGDSYGSTYGDLKKDVAAGTLRADVYFTHVISGLAAMASEGLLREWSGVPCLDFEKPWWNKSAIKNLSIANKDFYIVGSMSIQDCLVLIFNKDLISNLGLESPYNLVRTGKWTIDKLGEMAADGTKDLNGDGAFKEKDDQFGLEYGIVWQTAALMYSCGELSAKLDKNGYPAIELDNEGKINAYEKIYDLLWEGNKTFCFKTNNPPIGIDSNRVLFCQWNIFGCENLRASEVEYGILPLPKYDEKQEKYLSVSWTGAYALPVNIHGEKLGMIGTVMESMSALGHKDVIPAYYDILLKQKVSRDEDSIEMLDIIMGGIVYDVGLNFQVSSRNSPALIMTELLIAKNRNYVSAIEKERDQITAVYDDLYQKILEVGKNG